MTIHIREGFYLSPLSFALELLSVKQKFLKLIYISTHTYINYIYRLINCYMLYLRNQMKHFCMIIQSWDMYMCVFVYRYIDVSLYRYICIHTSIIWKENYIYNSVYGFFFPFFMVIVMTTLYNG